MTATQSWSAVEPATQPIPVVRRGNSPATAGFWLGIVGLLAGWVPFLGLLVTVPAWALSQAGRRRFRTGAATTAGRSGAGLALGVAGSVLCLLTTTIGIVGAANAPQPALPAAAPAVPAAAPAPAPVPVPVPDVVGMTDARAREVLAQAGFTNVVLGPPSAPAAGVTAGTVTAQDPVGSTTHDRAAAVTLVEAAAPAAPVAPAAAATGAPVDPDVDRPYVPARPLVATPPAPRTAVAAPRPAPQASRPAAPAPRPAAPAPHPAAPVAPAPAPASGGGSAYYANCTAARNAGVAPLYRGDPGYRSALDRDNDGIACE